MTKAIAFAAFIAAIASTASAYTSTRCYWIGNNYICTTVDGGSISTTRCYTIGNTVRCTSN